jgi:hypothetical protein
VLSLADSAAEQMDDTSAVVIKILDIVWFIRNSLLLFFIVVVCFVFCAAKYRTRFSLCLILNFYAEILIFAIVKFICNF